MFQSHIRNRDQKTLEQRNRQVCVGRKLHVEVMERRLMLSAAPLSLQQTSLSADLVSTLNINPTAASGQISFASNSSDGGLINVDVTVNTIPFTNYFGNANDSSVSAAFGRSAVDQMFDSVGLNISVAAPQFFSEGLQPWVIRSPESGRGDDSRYASLVRPGEAGADEGGSIAIGLAGSHPDLKPAPVSRMAEAPLASIASSLAPTRRTTLSESSISGEWARAVVFELTGEATHNRAESTESTETRSSESHNPPPATMPVSSEDSQRPIDPQHVQADGLPVTAAPRVEKQQHQTTGTGGPDVHDVSASAYNNAIAQLFQHAGSSEQPGGRHHGGAIVDRSFQGSSDVFAQINAIAADDIASKTPAFEPTGSNNWLRGSCIAAPLVLVLAMERLAALNSRRGTIDAAAFPKRRSRATAAT
jgi:hypothetical protein